MALYDSGRIVTTFLSFTAFDPCFLTYKTFRGRPYWCSDTAFHWGWHVPSHSVDCQGQDWL